MLSLHHIVLHKLSEKPLSGYSLCKEIEKSTGRKPSYGSIYPILERFAKEGLVTTTHDKRKKIYTLTPKGKSQAIAIKEQRSQLMDQMIAHSKMFCEITGHDPTPMITVLEQMKRGENPFGAIEKTSTDLRKTIFAMSQDGRLQKHKKEINSILTDATKRLQRLT